MGKLHLSILALLSASPYKRLPLRLLVICYLVVHGFILFVCIHVSVVDGNHVLLNAVAIRVRLVLEGTLWAYVPLLLRIGLS